MRDDKPKMKGTEPSEQEEGTEEMGRYYGVWEYGIRPSARPASKGDLSSVRKEMIRFALEHPIRDVRTYSGYKGDLLVQITTMDSQLLPLLQTHAESLGMKTVVKKRSDIGIHELYCITPDEDIYGIKMEEPE